MADPRFPIGKFHYEGAPSEDQRRKFIDEIEHMPTAIRAAVQGLSPEQLDTPYREGGWNVRQVVHHVPESHMNAYIRFKLALTEDEPTIKPYAEDRWARLADVQTTPKFLLYFWNRCTRDGCACCVLSMKKNGSERSNIPSWARFLWKRISQSMRGTDDTTLRTSPSCERE